MCNTTYWLEIWQDGYGWARQRELHLVSVCIGPDVLEAVKEIYPNQKVRIIHSESGHVISQTA